MTTLHQVLFIPRHVVTQVIEAEFIIGAIGDVGVVLLTALGRIHVRQNATSGHTKEVEYPAHKVALVFRQIVIHGDHMHTLTFKGVEIARQGGYKRLAFTRLHFCNVTPMQSGTTH